MYSISFVIFQDLGQTHASILNGDPNIILGHHAGQSQVTVSAAGGQQIPVSQIIATQSGQTHGRLIILSFVAIQVWDTSFVIDIF